MADTSAVVTPVPGTMSPPGDDAVRNDYLAGRAVAQRGDPASELDALLKPKASPANDTSPPSSIPSAPDLPIGQRILSGAGAVARDVGLGALDLPRQMAGGALDFGNNLMRFADDVVKRADAAGVPNLYFRLLDKDGNWSPAIQTPDEFRAAQAAGRDDVFQVPTTGGPDTVTGNIIRTGTTFLLGRGTSGGALAGAAGVAGRAGGELIRDAVSGAVGQDPAAPRLSNTIEQVAPNAVTEFLQAKPEDEGTILGRVKSGLEYAGLGTLFEGAGKALGVAKGLAASGDAETGLRPPAASGAPVAGSSEAAVDGTVAREAAPAPTTAGAEAKNPARDWLPLGDPLAPSVQAPRAPDIDMAAGRFQTDQAARAQVAPEIPREQVDAYFDGSGPNPVKINLARIGSGDDIANVLADVSRTIPANAVQSHDATIMLADALGLQAKDLLSGYRGQQLDAVQTTAMRMMLDSSGSQLIDFAKAASDPSTATPEAQATFLRAFATHRALQQYAENARNEAGRTLNAWSIMSQQRSTYAKAIGDLVNSTDANGDLSTMAQRIAELDNPLQASRLVQQSTMGTGRDGFLKVYYNVLLSNPKTVIKKLASDTGMAMWNLATRGAAETLGSGNVPAGETAALGYGYVSSLKDAVRMAGRALMAGESQFFRDYQSMDALGAQRLKLMAAGAPDLTPAATPARGALDYLRSALPTSWIGAADDFAKYANYRAELRALAYRDGIGEGLDPASPDMATHMAGLMDNPPPALHQQALTNALRNTFQDPLTGLAARVQDVADAMNIPIAHTGFELPIGRIILPFAKVPANIARWSYANSPLAAAFPSSAIRAEIAAGGATRDLAIARMGLGSAVSLGMADLALNHVVTGRGPSDATMHAAWRAAGNQPYSIRLGDRWYGYNQIEPLGLTMGAIADTFDTMRFAREQDLGPLAASLAFGIGNAMLSKTYLSGVAAVFDALQQPEQEAAGYVDRLLSGFAVPQGAAGLARATDPWLRAHYDLMQTIESRLPYVSQGLPPQRTLWGDPIRLEDGYLPFLTGTGAARMLSPVPTSRADQAEPIDQWIWDNRAAFPQADQGRLGLSRPGIVQSFGGGPHLATQVELTPQEYDRFQELAGNALKDGRGMGAKDQLNALVSGTHPDAVVQEQWNRATPGVRALIVQSVVNKYRAAAKDRLRGEFADLEAALQAGWAQRAQALAGQPANGAGAP